MTLEQAEKKAKKFFKDNHYYELDRCCDQCRFSTRGYEGEVNCTLAEPDEWIVGGVAQYGLCDKYESPPS